MEYQLSALCYAAGRVWGFVSSIDMLQNLFAESLSILVTVAVIDRLLKMREEKEQRTKWRATRARVGEIVGFLHTGLLDKLADNSCNAFEAVFEWSQDSLNKIGEAKQQYSYAFSAEMATSLEEYEKELRHLGGSVQSRQLARFDLLFWTNNLAIVFLKLASVPATNITHVFRWSPSQLDSIVKRLENSNINQANLPPVDNVMRF